MFGGWRVADCLIETLGEKQYVTVSSSTCHMMIYGFRTWEWNHICGVWHGLHYLYPSGQEPLWYKCCGDVVDEMLATQPRNLEFESHPC